MLEMKDINAILANVNKAFATSTAEVSFKKSATIAVASYSGSIFAFCGNDFFVPTEKLKPYGIRIIGDGQIRFGFKPVNSDVDTFYDFAALGLSELDDEFAHVYGIVQNSFKEAWLAYHMRTPNPAPSITLSSFLWKVQEKIKSKPALISQVNGALLGQSIDILEEQADIVAQSREDFYASRDDYGIF